MSFLTSYLLSLSCVSLPGFTFCNKKSYFVAFKGVVSMPRLSPSIVSYRFAPVDGLGCHYIVFDRAFRKIGNCDYIAGIWHFTPVGSYIRYVGFSRFQALSTWLETL